MEGPLWKFQLKTKNDMGTDPYQEGLFSQDELGYSDVLVRETSQNSLDARTDENKPVIVRFKISTIKDTTGLELFHTYIPGLVDHICAENNGIYEKPDFNLSPNFLVIEDFNTSGLEGDINEEDGDGGVGAHNFAYFWRNVGRSIKGEAERGRYGLGKAVYMKISKIKTYFGLTVRYSDSKQYLLGQSILKIHSLNEQKFLPYGFFGKFQDIPGEEFFALPDDETANIGNFKNVFGLNRDDKPGFSLVILYPEKDISIEALSKAAINQFLYAILNNNLSFRIENDQDTIIIDHASVYEKINEIYDEEEKKYFNRLAHFIEWAINVEERDYLLVAEQDLNYAPKWSADLFSKINLEELKENFSNGNPIAFKVPVRVQFKKQQPQHGWFKLFIQRDSNIDKGDVHFIREGIKITKESKIDRRGIRALVIVDDPPLTTMLGDSEPPAHTAWEKDQPKVRGKYDRSTSSIFFVKNSIKMVLKYIEKPLEGIEKDLLIDIFSIPSEEEKDPEPGKALEKERNKKVKGAKSVIPDIPLSPPRLIEVEKIKTGFSIRKSPKADSIPSRIKVRVAYSIGKGNPFQKHQIADFDFTKPDSGITIKQNNASLNRVASNRLEFKITGEPFEIRFTGFDEYRDLVTDVRAIRGE